MTTTIPAVLRVNPFGFTMTTGEKFIAQFDTTPQLVTGQSPSSPVVVCTDITTSTPTVVTLSHSPGVTGNLVTLQLVGTDFVGGHSYQLVLLYAADANTVWEMIQQIAVPF